MLSKTGKGKTELHPPLSSLTARRAASGLQAGTMTKALGNQRVNKGENCKRNCPLHRRTQCSNQMSQSKVLKGSDWQRDIEQIFPRTFIYLKYVMTPTALRRERNQMSGVHHYLSICLEHTSPLSATRHPGTVRSPSSPQLSKENKSQKLLFSPFNFFPFNVFKNCSQVTLHF